MHGGEEDKVMDEMNIYVRGNTYVVKVLIDLMDDFAKVIPFRIVVYKESDHSDMDYINLKKLNYVGEDLRQFLR